MPSQYNMGIDDDLFRGILEYDVQPTREEPNPHYDPQWRNSNRSGDLSKRPWQRTIAVPDGPLEPRLTCIGPYSGVAPIKRYITKNRGRYTNLRLKEIQKVGTWVAVDE